MLASLSGTRPKIAVVAMGALVLGLLNIAAASDAFAAVALTVSTTADIAANAGDCGSSSTTVPSPLSLREATCIANNYGNTQAVSINVPAGTYTLANGEIQLGKVSGSNITLNGAGSASTIIDGNHASRVLDLDPSIVGGGTTRHPAPTNASAVSASTLDQTAGSRTTPPRPTSLGPASNCGFTRATNVAASAETAPSGPTTKRSEMNDRSATTSDGAYGRSVGRRSRTFVRSIADTRASFRSRQSSWPYPTSTATT